jgi:hypothetical protein
VSCISCLVSRVQSQDGKTAQYDATDVNQGGLGDCWYLAAIAILADVRPDLFDKVFMKHDAELGVYTVRFCKNGEWRAITVDDHFPITHFSTPALGVYYQSVLFCNFGDIKDGVAEIWPMILEKAYAKLHGSYEAIEGGHTSDGLTDLTGLPSYSVDIQKKQSEIADGSFWKSILDWHENGFMMGCGSHSGSDTDHNNMGIVQGHAFSILNVVEVDGIRFMNIRNPHGTGSQEWQGDYSDKSDKWNRRLRSKLNVVEGGKEEGAWWMTFEDWAANYRTLYVCRTYPSTWQEVRARGDWKGEAAGGCSNNRTVKNNPHYLLKMSRPGTVSISLTQDDARGRSDIEEVCMGFYVYDRPLDGHTGGYPVGDVYRGQKIASTESFSWNRETETVEVKLERTDRPYVILPCTFRPGCVQSFIITVRCEAGIESLKSWSGNKCTTAGTTVGRI